MSDKLSSREIEIAFRAMQISMSEIMQVTRCLTIALASSLVNDEDEAFKELQEIAGRLDQAETYMEKAVKAVTVSDDAGE